MSITNELRKWGYGFCGDTHDVVTAIADRIDAEHEHGMEERADRYSELRAKMDDCYIELPKDADGKHIQPYDIPHLTKVKDGKKLAYYPSLELRQDGTWRLAGWTLDRYRIIKPTVEDVLREFSERVLNSGHQWGLDAADTIAEYATKLRLAEGEDA